MTMLREIFWGGAGVHLRGPFPAAGLGLAAAGVSAFAGAAELPLAVDGAGVVASVLAGEESVDIKAFQTN